PRRQPLRQVLSGRIGLSSAGSRSQSRHGLPLRRPQLALLRSAAAPGRFAFPHLVFYGAGFLFVDSTRLGFAGAQRSMLLSISAKFVGSERVLSDANRSPNVINPAIGGIISHPRPLLLERRQGQRS